MPGMLITIQELLAVRYQLLTPDSIVPVEFLDIAVEF